MPNKLEDIRGGIIEIEESELGAGINIDQIQTSEEEDKENNPAYSNAAEIEIENEHVESHADNNEQQSQEGSQNNQKSSTEGDEFGSDAFQAFATLYKKQGGLPDVTDEELGKVESAKGLIELMNKQLNQVNKGWQEEYRKNLFNNLVKDGYIPQDKADAVLPKSFTEEQIKGNEQVALNVIKTFYQMKGVPEAQINSITQGIVDVEEEALKLNPYITDMRTTKEQEIANKIKTQEDTQATQQQNLDSSLKKTVYDYKEFMPGRELSDADKEAVYQNIIPALNKVNSNLEKYAPIISFLDTYNLLDGDMTKLKNESSTKQVSEFEKILQSKKRGQSAGGGTGGGATGGGVTSKKRGYSIYE